MNTTKTNKLYESFPALYRERTMTLAQSQMPWGFQCGDGWFNIVWELSEKLNSLALRDDSVEGSLRVNEVRAEEGQLVVGLTNAAPDARDVVEHAQIKSQFTCELCGHAPSYLRKHPDFYQRVVCGRCMKKGKKRSYNKNLKRRSQTFSFSDVVVEKR